MIRNALNSRLNIFVMRMQRLLSDGVCARRDRRRLPPLGSLVACNAFGGVFP
jgi:hypothetical protein